MQLDQSQPQPMQLDQSQTQPMQLDQSQPQPMQLNQSQPQPMQLDQSQTQPGQLDQSQPEHLDEYNDVQSDENDMYSDNTNDDELDATEIVENSCNIEFKLPITFQCITKSKENKDKDSVEESHIIKQYTVDDFLKTMCTLLRFSKFKNDSISEEDINDITIIFAKLMTNSSNDIVDDNLESPKQEKNPNKGGCNIL